jgi:hypothetical protein
MFEFLSGARNYQVSTRGMIKTGFTAKGYARKVSGGYDWTKFFALNGLGALAAVADHLPSFSTQLLIKQTFGGTTYQYFLFNGCKMNKLLLTAKSPGQPIEWEIGVLARWPSFSNTKVFTGLQSVTVGADAADPNTADQTVCWTGIPQFNLAGGGYVNFQPRNWKLTIDNHVEATPGNVLGADSNYYPCANTLEEGPRDIIFEAILPAVDQTFQNAKRLGSVMTGIKIPVDAKTITLGTGYFEENDFPAYAQKINDESIKLRFQGITIA